MSKYTRKQSLHSIKSDVIQHFLVEYSQPALIRLLSSAYHGYHSSLYPLFSIVDAIQMNFYSRRLMRTQAILLPRFENILIPYTNRQDERCHRLNEYKRVELSRIQVSQ